MVAFRDLGVKDIHSFFFGRELNKKKKREKEY